MRRLPRFVPILTSYAQRVSGRPLGELMNSSAAMARALADTHKLIGCDGALCFWDPAVLLRACTAGDQQRDAEDVISAPAFQFLLQTARALREQLPRSTQLFATFAGPALLASQLAHCSEENYADDVVLAAVRAGLEAGTQGVALIESGSVDSPEVYRAMRKLADFYDATILIFQLAGTEAAVEEADCVFRLTAREAVETVLGSVKSGTAPVSTSCDVPPETPVESLRALQQVAARLSNEC